jgi:hypothetical protein
MRMPAWLRRYLGHMNWNALLYDPDNKVTKVLQPGEVRLHANANIYASKPPTFSRSVWLCVRGF